MARVSAACHCTVSINSRLRYCMDVLWKKPQLPQVQISFTHLIWLHFTQQCLPPPPLPPPEELSCFFISPYTHTCNSFWLHKFDLILIFFMGCMHRLFKASKSSFFSWYFITHHQCEWPAVAVPGFPKWGSIYRRGECASLLFGKLFDENCLKMKEIGPGAPVP